MRKKSLMETNPYLRDPKTFEKFLFVSVSSSAAIELGKLPPALEHALKSTNFKLIFIPPADGTASL